MMSEAINVLAESVQWALDKIEKQQSALQLAEETIRNAIESGWPTDFPSREKFHSTLRAIQKVI